MNTVAQHVLIVEDEPAIVEILARYLRDEGFQVSEAHDGLAAVEKTFAQNPDLLILDLNLPRLSGVEAFRRIRAVSNVPVIMLTSRVNEVDRIVGLELGADDYVGKPFSPREVVARVKSVLRRSGVTQTSSPAKARADIQAIGRLEIDRAEQEVRVEGACANLTPVEFRILDVLASNLGRTITRDQLLDKVFAGADDVFDRTIDRHIANLRRKLEPTPSNPTCIVTVFGRGYKMVKPV